MRCSIRNWAAVNLAAAARGSFIQTSIISGLMRIGPLGQPLIERLDRRFQARDYHFVRQTTCARLGDQLVKLGCEFY
jgi:hypothetical protein